MLLTILAEECAEVAQRVSKALRFGLKEVQEGQSLTNGERIIQEYNDLLAVMEMLRAENIVVSNGMNEELMRNNKKAKVEKYLLYSAKIGTMEAEEPKRELKQMSKNIVIYKGFQVVCVFGEEYQYELRFKHAEEVRTLNIKTDKEVMDAIDNLVSINAMAYNYYSGTYN